MTSCVTKFKDHYLRGSTMQRAMMRAWFRQVLAIECGITRKRRKGGK